MRDLNTLTAKQLLRVRTPESLFSPSPTEAKAEYRALIRQWHPDRRKSPEASIVLEHIMILYKQAIAKFGSGTWNEPVEKVEDETPGIVKFRSRPDNAIKTYEYITARDFEFGQMYIGDHYVVFEVQPEFEEHYTQARKQIQSLRFKNAEMATEMSKYLPQILERFSTVNAHLLVIRKTPDQVLLADVCKYMGRRIEPIEHVGWILNALYNMACYLEWSGVTHNALSTTTLFISPLRHSVMLLGGWWYSVAVGGPLRIVPNRTLDCMPADVLCSKSANVSVDLELIKSLGLELLGETKGKLIWGDDSIPESLRDWLSSPSSGSSVTDYKDWKYEVLTETFGMPKFCNLKLTTNEIYKEI